jgi:hypothetical protein
MKSLLIPSRSVTRRWLSLGAAALQVVFALGCASPGPPHAPSLNLPEIVKDLTAERVGDSVKLHWTTSEKTTDHLAIKGTITAEICRTSLPAPASTPSCTVVKRLPVQTGLSQAEEILPPSLTVDPASLLAYKVQLFNAHNRSAGSSPEAFAAAGAAPQPVEQLRATSVREGVQLEWQQPKNSSPENSQAQTQVQLDRHLVSPPTSTPAPAPAHATSTAPKPALQSKSRKASPHSAFTSAKPQATPTSSPETSKTPDDVKLETPKQTPDAGGTIDQTTEKTASYRYTARRIRDLSLAGHALQLRSEVSAPITITMLDTFPPAIPTGLEAVPGGATPSDRSIDLSWTPNTEVDLAGYSVYRQEVTSTGQVAGPAARLNPSPIVGPAYRDQTAIPGHRYAYRVTAVDATGNESAPSADVQETLREQ